MKKKIIKNIILSKGCVLQTHIFRRLYANSFELYVYDTRANMTFGIRKWLIKRGYKQELPNAFAGMFLEIEKDEIWTDEESFDYKVFGAMFLNLEDFTVDILAHESLHAAMTYERNIIRFVGLYDGNDDTGEAPEERLAYTVGEFVNEVMKSLISNKIKFELIDKEDKKCKDK